MANRDRHRRFGNVRRRESGRYQIRYPGPDGRMRTGPETYERKSDADRALVMIGPDLVVRWAHQSPSPLEIPGANLIFDALSEHAAV